MTVASSGRAPSASPHCVHHARHTRSAAAAANAAPTAFMQVEVRRVAPAMNFLFKPKQRAPYDLVRGMHDAMTRLGVVAHGSRMPTLGDAPGGDARRKLSEELYAGIQQAKHILYGEGGHEPVPELVAQLAQEVYQVQLLQYLLVCMPRLEFEARKDVVQIFAVLLQRTIGTRLPTVEYIVANPSIVLLALRGYDDPEIALNTGMILHEIVQHEALAKILLYSDE